MTLVRRATLGARVLASAASVFSLLFVLGFGSPAALGQTPQADSADEEPQLPLPQSDGEQPTITDDQTPNPAPVPGGGTARRSARESEEDFEDDNLDGPGAPNIDAIRIATLSVWIGTNAALAAGYTRCGILR